MSVVTKAWFSLAHKHKHRDIPTFDSILDTSSPQPSGWQDGRCFVHHIAFDNYVRMRSGSNWPTIGLGPCAYACAYVTLFSLVKLQHQHKHKHKKSELVCFSCAYAYAYALVKTRLKISNCRVNTTSGWVIRQLGIFLLVVFFFYFPMKVAGGHIRGSRGKALASGSYKVSSLWCAAKWSFALYDC